LGVTEEGKLYKLGDFQREMSL